MSTKARGDSAEYRVVAELLERGHTVLMPCGDRLPYDIGIDVGGKLVRVQVRRAYPTRGVKGGSYKIDVRRSMTLHAEHARCRTGMRGNFSVRNRVDVLLKSR